MQLDVRSDAELYDNKLKCDGVEVVSSEDLAGACISGSRDESPPPLFQTTGAAEKH